MPPLAFYLSALIHERLCNTVLNDTMLVVAVSVVENKQQYTLINVKFCVEIDFMFVCLFDSIVKKNSAYWKGTKKIWRYYDKFGMLCKITIRATNRLRQFLSTRIKVIAVLLHVYIAASVFLPFEIDNFKNCWKSVQLKFPVHFCNILYAQSFLLPLLCVVEFWGRSEWRKQ